MGRFVMCALLCASCGGGEEAVQVSREPDLDPPGARWQQRDQLAADLEAPRHASDGGGSGRVVELDGRTLAPDEVGEVIAGERHRFAIEFTVGPEGIAAGGAVYFMPEPFWGWSMPQNITPERLGYVTMEGLEVSPQQGPLLVGVAAEGVAAGGVLRIEYGLTGGAQVDLYAERGSRLWIAVDGDGDGVRKVVDDSPVVDVLPRPASRIAAHLPSRVRPGDEVRLVLAVLDEAGNVVVDSAGSFRAGDLERELDQDDRGATFLTWIAEDEGVQRLLVEFEGESGTLFTCETNPMLVQAGAAPLVWADLHGHSQLSDGTGRPTDYLRYARDVAGLDVIALTDHDHFGVRFLDQREDLWEDIRQVTAEFHEPGRFVALLGFEWTNWVHGHRHVLYFTDEGKPLSSLDPATDTPAGLWDALRGQDALTLAHHSAGDPVPVNWTFPPDPELEPVTEIMSVHGSSEAADSPSVVRGARPGHFVRDVLDDGIQFGFVGSGDSHDGHPGLPHLNPMYGYLEGRNQGQGGVAALEAERTRASVLEALRERRCYATSGPRILLEVHLGGTPAGGLLSPAVEHELDLSVLATAPIERIEVIRSGAIVQGWTGSEERAAQVRYVLKDLVVGEYVYARVVQVDRGLAWSSPIFVR